jgi:hypothetical protein
MKPGQDVLGSFDAACAAEWVLTDGLGGRAAGTAAGASTRRGHALLVASSEALAALEPARAQADGHAGPALDPGARLALLLRFDDRVVLPGVAVELTPGFAANGAPRWGAFANLEHVAAEPWPVWRWRFEGWLIERRYRMVPGHAALVATWRLLEGEPARLAVAPVIAHRDVRALQAEEPEWRGAAQGIPGRVRIETAPGATPLTLWHNGAFMPGRSWTRAAYPHESRLDDGDTTLLVPPSEAGFVPGAVHARLEPGVPLHVVVSPEAALFRALATEGRLGTPPAQTLDRCVAEIERGVHARRRALTQRALAGADWTARQAAVVYGGAGETLARRPEPVVSGEDGWTAPLGVRVLDAVVTRTGRATLRPRDDGSERFDEVLRMVPALVALRAFEDARAVLRAALEYLDEGLAPESFDDAGAPHYGDPRPSLWLVHAVDLLARRQPQGALDPFVRDTAWPALEGVMQHLRSGSHHGVRCDRDGLLWQGEGEGAIARADTNALWYHALVAMAQLGKLAGRREHAAFYLAWAHDLQRLYRERFADAATGALFEAVTPRGPVRGLSPHQLLAVSLPPAVLAPEHAARLVAVIERELLAPGGLRVAPDDSRVEAGALGPWLAARRRLRGRDAPPDARAALALETLRRELDAGRARLEPLDAAELLRAWIEDVEHAGVVIGA